MDTLYTFGDSSTHYKIESGHFLGLMNSATKIRAVEVVALETVPGTELQALL